MLPTEISIAQYIANSVTNPVTYATIVIVIGILLRIALVPFYSIPDSFKTLISLIVPIILLEPFLSLLFGMVGITLDWGVYVYSIPLYGNINTNIFIMFSKFMNLIFGFGIFSTFGLPYLTEYIKTVSITLPEPDILLKVFIFVYVSLDSVLEYIFFYLFFYSCIIILSDTLNGSSANSKMYALLLALIPVAFYNIFISNPITEYSKSVPMIQQLLYFSANAPIWNKIMFFGTFIISFLLVMEIIAVGIDILHRFGASTIKPRWETKRYEESPTGMGFVYAIAYGIMFTLKGVSWYVFFSLLILYSTFKSFSGNMIDNVKIHDANKDMQKGIVEMIEKKGVDDEGGMNWGAILIVIGLGGIVGWLWMMGWIKI